MPHHKARFTAHGRAVVVDHGQTFAQAGAVPEQAQICRLRQRTGWSQRRLADECGRPRSTVHRVLQRGDCARHPRPEGPEVVRYE